MSAVAIASARARLISGVCGATLSVAAAGIAYLLTTISHIQGLWACITAIAVTQANFTDTLKLGKRQFVGAVIGGAVSLCLVALLGTRIWVGAIAVFLSITICSIVSRRDSGPLAGITATIVVLDQITGPPELTAIFRLSEVALGALSGMVVVWLQHWIAGDRRSRPADSSDRPSAVAAENSVR